MTYEIAPVPPTPGASGGGRAARAGSLVAACLVLGIGAAVVIGASAAPRTPAGAEPSASGAARSANPAAQDKGNSGQGKEFRGGAAFGTITIASIDGTRIGLRTADGWTRTIDVAADTKIFLGSQAGQVSDLAVGNEVRLRQKRNADGSFAIVSLTVPAARANGEVTAVSGNSITIRRRGGSTTTLTVNSATVYRQGDADASKADVKVGSKIGAEGRPGSSDAFTATIVRISLTHVVGEVTAKTADTISVKQRDGSTVVVHVDADTRYRARGANRTTASLADVEVGARLEAAGVRRSDGSLDAVAVGTGRMKASKPPRPAAPSPSAANG